MGATTYIQRSLVSQNNGKRWLSLFFVFFLLTLASCPVKKLIQNTIYPTASSTQIKIDQKFAGQQKKERYNNVSSACCSISQKQAFTNPANNFRYNISAILLLVPVIGITGFLIQYYSAVGRYANSFYPQRISSLQKTPLFLWNLRLLI